MYFFINVNWEDFSILINQTLYMSTLCYFLSAAHKLNIYFYDSYSSIILFIMEIRKISYRYIQKYF